MHTTVLLVDPVYNSGVIPPNVSLGKIEAKLVANNVEVILHDFVSPECELNSLDYFHKIENEYVDNLKEKAKKSSVAYITAGHGNELKPYPMFPRIVRCIEILKKANPSIKVIVGGALINFYCKLYNVCPTFFYNIGIDEIIIGNEYKAIDSIAKILNLKFDNNYYPSKWLNWNISKYPNYISIMYHTGCPYNCDFCFEGKIYDKSSQFEDIDGFIETIEFIKDHYKINKFIIEDSTIMSYADFDDLIYRLKTQQIEFAAYARVSEIVNNPDKLLKMKEAGCQSLIIGIETLNDNILKTHHKNLINEQTSLALNLLKKNKINIQGCFMLGFPDDDIINMEKTIDFALAENMNGYRWHIYQPNYQNIDNRFYSNTNIRFEDHFNVQLNVPDHCLSQMTEINPEIAILDEHFLIRAKNYIGDVSYLKNIGYQGCFSYLDIYNLLCKFPKHLILNEENLYKFLFNEQ